MHFRKIYYLVNPWECKATNNEGNRLPWYRDFFKKYYLRLAHDIAIGFSGDMYILGPPKPIFVIVYIYYFQIKLSKIFFYKSYQQIQNDLHFETIYGL